MKKLVILFALLLYASVHIAAQSPYYYYKGQKIGLIVNRNYLNVIAAENSTKFSADSLRQINFEMQSSDVKSAKIAFKNNPDSIEYADKVKALKANTNVKLVLPYFEREGAEPIGVSDVFYVKLKNKADTVLLGRYVKMKNLRIVKQVSHMPLWYIIQLQSSQYGNTLDVANFLHETGDFEDIDPAFMFNFRKECTNDPLFNQLWGLSNSSNQTIDINACEAWSLSSGSGIMVAVVDQGIDANHNDLAANIHSLSFDAKSGTSPSVFISGNTHGTHVAGTIAAVKNNLQVIGVAPESKIIRVSHDLYVSTTLSAELASGISWAWQNGADVISNSWGDKGGQFYSNLHSSILENAITNAMTQGRNNRGCVVVFAAGNYAPVMDYPASFHNDILTVGSISSNGSRASSSGYGNQLDIVAPGVNILSTLPNNGTGVLSGTSMAAPHVAGVAALILSVNPDLTQAQVRQAIESTAQKVGGYNYQTTTGRPNGTWHGEMGYGLVNAYAAVNSVLPALSGPSTMCAGTPATFTVTNAPAGYTWSSSANLALVSTSGNTASFLNLLIV